MIKQKQRKILLMIIGGLLLILISIGILFLFKKEKIVEKELPNNTEQIEEGTKVDKEKLPKEETSPDNSKDEDESPPPIKEE